MLQPVIYEALYEIFYEGYILGLGGPYADEADIRAEFDRLYGPKEL